MQQRIGWIDALKFFAMFLVVWGHSVQQLVSFPPHENFVFRLIYSFHMPLFMALSGFFVEKSLQKSNLTFIVSKFRQLILPILSLTCFFFIIREIGKLGGVVEENWILSFKPENNYWFLKSAFLCSIIYFIIAKSGKFFYPLLILSIILSQCFFLNANFYNGTHIATMFPSFVLGAMIQKHFKWFITNATKITICSGLIFITMSLFWSKWFYELIYFHDVEMGRVTLENTMALLFQRGYKLVIGLFGSIFFISIFEVLSHKIKRNNTTLKIEKWGSITLGIYLLQTILLENTLVSIINFDEYNFFIFNFVITPIISLFVLSICIVIIGIIERSKWLKFLFLGSKMPDLRNNKVLQN